MKSVLVVALMSIAYAEEAREPVLVQRGLDAFGQGDWSAAVQLLEGSIQDSKNTREVLLTLGLAHAKLAQQRHDASGVQSFQKARGIFQSLAQSPGPQGVQAVFGLASLACLENQRPSNAVFQGANQALREKLKGNPSRVDVEKLQKALLYLEFVRFKKAWKVENPPGEGPGGENPQVTKGKDGGKASKAPDEKQKTSGKLSKGETSQNQGEPTPGKGNLELVDWKGDVGPLNKAQAADLVEQASLKILYPGKASKP